jgi:hypothetical protein
MENISKEVMRRSSNKFSKLVQLFSIEKISHAIIEKFKEEWSRLNREMIEKKVLSLKMVITNLKK